MSALAALSPPARNLAPLRAFVTRFAEVVETAPSEQAILSAGAPLLAELVGRDDWLPDDFARPDPNRYTQYLLYWDSQARFSVVSFAWGPGQATPVHDHRVWGMVGVLRGAELVETFAFDPEGDLVSTGPAELLPAGAVDAFGPAVGDIHRVANAHDDRVSISIHVYGANIGAVERATYDAFGRPKRFVSGYANDVPLDLWGADA